MDKPPSLVETPRASGVGRLLVFLIPMAFSLYANFQGLQQILIPAQVEAIDPPAKVANLALITIIGSFTGILGLTLGGAASDATRGRWGRRAPWLVGMAAASCGLSLALGLQRSLVGVAALSGTLWLTLNFFQGAMLAVTPDRVPEKRRGFASSMFSFAGPLGGLIGFNAAALLPGELGHAALAALLAATTAAFVIFMPDAPYRPPPQTADEAAAARGGRLRLALAILESFRARDFSLAYGFRVLMFTAQFAINNYLLYILQDHIGAAAIPGHDPRLAVGLLSSLRTLATIAAAAIGLWLVNRTERRKVFAQVYAIGMAAAMLAPVVSPTWTGMLVFSLGGGLAIGAYATIDLAMMSLVLPNKRSAGRDLALLVMAGATAQSLAPPLAGFLIRFLGYDALFQVAALVTLLAGAVTLFIRGVP